MNGVQHQQGHCVRGKVRKEWKVGGKGIKYIVLILGVSNNSGNKHRGKKSTKAKQSRHVLFYVATGHFSTWKMDVNLLPE